jgi:pilus assembly protein CpaE
MLVHIIGDDTAEVATVRKALAMEGIDCPASHVLSLASAAKVSGQADLAIVVMGPDADRSLSVLAGLRASSAARVLAVGEASDPKLLIRALRSGADSYVDRDDLSIQLRDALARYRGSLGGQHETGRLIAVLAPSGGSGSSTIAANVAAVLAKEHKQTALLDLKLEAGDLAALLDLKPTYTLADLCQDVARVDRTLFERSLVKHSSGVNLLAPTRQLSDARQITPEGVAHVVNLARAGFPYVIADLDHSYDDEQVEVLMQADIILLVLRLEFASLRNARRALEHLEALGIDKGRIRLVINRYGQAREVPAAKAEDALGVKIFHYIPDEPKTVMRACNNGVPFVLDAPATRVSKSLAKLSAEVNGRHRSA